MPVTLNKDVTFGADYGWLTGSSGVCYDIRDASGAIVTGPITAGVYEVVTGSGIFAADVTFPDSFHGQIVWTAPATGSLPVSYASEQYNVEENDPKVASTWSMVSSVTGSIQGLFDVAFGRWKIDTVANTMTIYRDDNTTVVATFNLMDDTGTPSYNGVFERQLVGPVVP